MYDIKKIMDVLPHRPPFLLIDKIVECGNAEIGSKVVAIKNVTMNEDFFRGHFPNEPVMPGVLIVEAIAQTGAFMVLSQQQFKNKIAYFGAIDKVKFKQVVKPGDVLTMEMEITKFKGTCGVGKGVAYVNDKVAVSGIFTFFIK